MGFPWQLVGFVGDLLVVYSREPKFFEALHLPHPPLCCDVVLEYMLTLVKKYLPC